MAQDEGNMPPQEQTPAKDATAQWRSMLDRHGAQHGFHLPLGDRHGVLYTADERTLIVSFESASALRATELGLPLGLQVAGREGWSSLAVYSEGDTWFRDEAVFHLFDTLQDENFFDDFDRVLFCGAGAGAYAAAAFSVVAPGAHLLLMRPQATLDPAVAGWDQRYRAFRRADWTSRYGYAPVQVEAAERVTLVYDPHVPEDAMHAALFQGERIQKLPLPYLGPRLERDLDGMGVLMPMIRLAGKGHLSRHRFGKLYQRRRTHMPYLRRLLEVLEARDAPWLTALLARSVLRDHNAPRFRKALQAAEATLVERGLELPPEPAGNDD